jgi:hypothetical protein
MANGSRWLKHLPLAISLTSTALGGLVWIDTHYAKAEEVDRLKQSVAELGVELKISVLQNRRSTLRGEQFRLQSQRPPSALERQRLFEVSNDLADVEQQLEQLRRR